jgi:hypothetical protein
MKERHQRCENKIGPALAPCLVLFVLFGFFCQTKSSFAAEGFRTRSFAIPINVEGEHIRSSLFLKLEIKYYNIPLAEFASAPLDDRERAFFQLADGIRKKNYGQVEQLLRSASKEKVESERILDTKDESIQKTVDLYWSAFGGFENIQVVCQVLVGAKSLFVWEARTGKVQMRRGFAVWDGHDKKPMATEVTMNTPIDLLIVNMLEHAAKHPESYKPLTDLVRRYEYPLPVDRSANPGPHSVFLQFNGEPFNFNVFDEKTIAPNEVINLYRNAYLDFRNNSIDQFMKLHTPKSQAKLRDWYSTMSIGTFKQYMLTVTRGRYVKFLINADPVYIVFYSPDASDQWKPGTLSYQYIVRKKESPELKIANVFYESFLDDVLKSNELFDQGVFRKSSFVP